MSDEWIGVTTDAQRDAATVWESQSDALRRAASTARGLRLTTLEAGIFAPLVAAYDRVVDVASGRCAEGAERTVGVAGALRASADAYDRREAERARRLDGEGSP
jgi:hypothetical protein